MKKRKKYRILVVVRKPVGGIRTFIKYIYKHFDQSLYHFTILTRDIMETRMMVEDLNKLDVDYMLLESDPTDVKLLWAVTKAIFRGKFDLVHSHGYTAGLCAILPARLTRTKHVLTPHETLYASQFTGKKGYLKIKCLSFFLPMIDLIHILNTDAYENLVKFIPKLRIRNKNLSVITSGIDVLQFSSSKERNLHGELNLPDANFLIGYFGRFTPEKGFDILIEALQELLKRSDLPKNPIIIPFGDGGFIREEKEVINEKGIKQYFHFLPFVQNVAPSLKGLDLVVMPSLRETCPILPMEAMVAGVPFIGTNCIGLRVILNGTPSVMVPAGNSTALAEAIANEIKNPSREKAKAFSAEAAKRFDAKKKSAELEKVIQRLPKGC